MNYHAGNCYLRLLAERCAETGDPLGRGYSWLARRGKWPESALSQPHGRQFYGWLTTLGIADFHQSPSWTEPHWLPEPFYATLKLFSRTTYGVAHWFESRDEALLAAARGVPNVHGV